MTRKNPERRQELITAAQQLFYTKGYEHTSVNDIIQAVGVSKGAFYHHFDSKTAVLEAVVTGLTKAHRAYLDPHFADTTLTIQQKWSEMLSLSSNWKLGQKDEFLAIGRILMMDENVLLREKLMAQRKKVRGVFLAELIAQGNEEGLFDVACVRETAAIVLAILNSLGFSLQELLLNPVSLTDQPASVIAWNQVLATQTAVERVLGATPGSLPILDQASFLAWFEK